MTVEFKYAAFTDVGLIRKGNEDGGYASSHLLVLADGMGGAAAGEIASSVVVGYLAAIDDSHQAEDLLPLLRSSLNKAREDLYARSQANKELEGMGTTCIAVLRTSNKLGMVHVGDSRAYILRGDRLIQVTRDHTLVQFLVDQGELTPEEAAIHPKRNVIMRNIGDSPEPLELDESIREAIVGDRWLLCSDGLTDVVSKETIGQTLMNYANIEACGERLIELALAGGAPDNVTVVLADVVDTDNTGSFDHGPIVVGSAAVDHRKPTRAGASAAGQAAALTASTKEIVLSDDDEEIRPRLVARIAATLAVLAIIVGGLFASYSWTQSQYFVAKHEGHVTIFRGIPQDIGPITLSTPIDKSDIEIEDLSPVAQQRLTTPITRSSMEDAQQVVTDLRAQIISDRSPETSTTPSPSAPTKSVTPDRGKITPSPTVSATTPEDRA